MSKSLKQAAAMLWAGTDQAFDLYIESLSPPAQLEAGGIVLNKVANGGETENTSGSRLLTINDGIGLISIGGVLTDRDSWWNAYAGLVSYNEVREALYLAVANPGVKEILMDVASPGGAVNGVLDAVSAVAEAASVKRLTAYTDSQATSAAYWMIAPARDKFASAVATVGSIGVVGKHVEHSKAASMAGYKETLIRSGPFKQIANSSEPLSPKAEEVLQDQVDHVAEVFNESVAKYLGTTAAIVDSKMGQGREFIGSQAVEVGLIDKISSFDKVYSAIQQRVAKAGGGMPQGGDMKKKYAISAATAMTAAAAGVELPEAEVTEPVAASGDPVTAEEPGVTTEGTTAEGTPSAASEPAPAVDLGAESAVVSLLKSQVKERDEELFSLKTEVLALKGLTEGVDQLKAIVAQTINTMAVSIGGSADPTLTEASVTSLLAQHASTQTRFTAHWAGVVPGGAASTVAEVDGSVKAPELSREAQAKIDAASPSKSRAVRSAA